MSDSISYFIEKGIATIELNRPDKHNAISLQMLSELQQALDNVISDRAHVVILTGSGEKAFCAGGDINEWSELKAEKFTDLWIAKGQRVFSQLAQLPVPVIAVINGLALGGGLELAACADYRIAEEQAVFAMPEANLGMVPGWSGTQRAVRRFGVQPIKLMALFGQSFNAKEAEALNMVEQVVAKGQGMKAALALAQILKQRGSLAKRIIKNMLNIAEGEAREQSVDSIASLLIASSVELETKLEAYFTARAAQKGN